MANTDTVYEQITNRIIKALEAGTIPWHKPWKGGASGMPRNAISNRPYSGINLWLLSLSGFTSPLFMTFRQAKELGGSVKRGEHGTGIIFWKRMPSKQVIDNATGKEKTVTPMLLRSYVVFNLSQCDLPAKALAKLSKETSIAPSAFTPIEQAQAIADGWEDAPRIRHGASGAWYHPASDTISMPDKHQFPVTARYYSTLFHEMTHSTGHTSRLNRATINDAVAFGSTNYSKEELCAEMGAAFLCGVAGIENETIDESAAYIANWLEKLKGDVKFVVNAAQLAQKAANAILGASEAPSASANVKADASAGIEAQGVQAA